MYPEKAKTSLFMYIHSLLQFYKITLKRLTLPCFQASRHFLSFLNAFQIILGWFWQHVIHWDSDSQGLWFRYQLLLVLLLNEQFTTLIAFGSLQNSATPEWKDLFIGSSFSRGGTWDFEWLPQVCGVGRRLGQGLELFSLGATLHCIRIYTYFFYLSVIFGSPTICLCYPLTLYES